MKSIERGGKRERGEERSEVISGKCMGNIPLTGIFINAGSLALMGSDSIAWHF